MLAVEDVPFHKKVSNNPMSEKKVWNSVPPGSEGEFSHRALYVGLTPDSGKYCKTKVFLAFIVPLDGNFPLCSYKDADFDQITTKHGPLFTNSANITFMIPVWNDVVCTRLSIFGAVISDHSWKVVMRFRGYYSGNTIPGLGMVIGFKCYDNQRQEPQGIVYLTESGPSRQIKYLSEDTIGGVPFMDCLEQHLTPFASAAINEHALVLMMANMRSWEDMELGGSVEVPESVVDFWNLKDT